MRMIWPVGARALVVALAVGQAADAAATLSITRWTVDGGGMGYVQLGNFITAGTIGQPDARLLVGRDLTVSGGFWVPGGPLPTGVDDDDGGLPGPDPLPLAARIYAAAPNPVMTQTALRFDLPDARDVEIRVFDVTGALRQTLASGTLPAGRHAVSWGATDSRGQRVKAGVYLVRIRLGSLERSQKLLVMR